MLRVQPTRITLNQEDLKEYEDAREKWVAAKEAKAAATTSPNQQDSTQSAVVNNNHNNLDSNVAHRRAVQSRLGLSTDDNK